MKNLNNCKVRPRHKIIAILRNAQGAPVAANSIRDQLAILMPFGGRRTDDGAIEISSYISSIRLDDGIINTTRVKSDLEKTTFYSLVNFWAFDEKGHRFVTPTGNRWLTDEEIKEMHSNGMTPTGNRWLTDEEIKEMHSNGVVWASIATESAEVADETVIENPEETLDYISAESLFEDNETVDETVNMLAEFPLASDAVSEPFVSAEDVIHVSKPKRFQENGKFISRARAIELGLITAEAA